uniref:PMS1-like protein n=1 Tax=Lingulaulax polyedra TaxID=160621 RepID=A0A516AGA5_LINPO|nr:PMS1-like protein [Lingulodinium polyedra]
MEQPPGQPPVVGCGARLTVGCSFQATVSMANLGSAVARRRHRAGVPGAGQVVAAASAAPSLQFPSAFSLASLRADETGRSSVEEVAKFNTGNVHTQEAGGAESTAFKFDKSCFSQMRVIGQFNLGFIIAALRTKGKDDDEPGRAGAAAPAGSLQLFIIDQHASDEKFRFEGLNRESRIDRQPLVTPHHLQLTPAQEQLAESHRQVFQLNGFELRRDEARPPGRRLRLASLPSCQGLVFGEKDVHDLLYNLEEAEAEQSRPSTQDASARGGLLDLSGHRALWSSTALPRPPKVWQLLACRACRGAVMIGKALRVAEMEKILANLSSLQQPWNCPHGRPTMRHLIDTGAARKAPRPPQPLASLLAQARQAAA